MDHSTPPLEAVKSPQESPKAIRPILQAVLKAQDSVPASLCVQFGQVKEQLEVLIQLVSLLEVIKSQEEATAIESLVGPFALLQLSFPDSLSSEQLVARHYDLFLSFLYNKVALAV